MKTDGRGLYLMALTQWGDRAQIIMAMEELAECSAQLARYLRGRVDIGPAVEEIADATIMLEQMAIIFPGVEEAREHKLARLRERLRGV